MDPTEAILTPDTPGYGIQPRCFAGKPRCSSGKCPIQPLIDGNVPFLYRKITGGNSATAKNRQKHRLVAVPRGGRKKVPTIMPGYAAPSGGFPHGENDACESECSPG